MQLKTFACLLASPILAFSLTNFPCGAEPPEGFRAMTLEIKKKEDLEQLSSPQLSGDKISVPTWFHVVYANKTEEGGFIPETQLTAQFKKMHDIYEPHDIFLDFSGSTYTENANWSHAGPSSWDEMKKALRKGGYGTLNVYFTLLTKSGLLGKCTFPEHVESNSAGLEVDGCNVQANTMPGGLGYPGAEHPEKLAGGGVAVHESGHWFGLLHTFVERSCEEPDNDLIDDTPVHLRGDDESSYSCPPGKDTCSDLPGEDPTFNFMSYQYDECYDRFTKGQGKRARSMWNKFRNGHE